MRLEVLGADGQGRLTLSDRSARRYLPLDVLSNSLLVWSWDQKHAYRKLSWNVGGHNVLVRLARPVPSTYHPPKSIDRFDLIHRLLVVLSSSCKVVGLLQIPAGVQTLT